MAETKRTHHRVQTLASAPSMTLTTSAWERLAGTTLHLGEAKSIQLSTKTWFPGGAEAGSCRALCQTPAHVTLRRSLRPGGNPVC